MEHEKVDFIQINAIPSASIQIVNSFHTRATQNGEPFQMVLNTAFDKRKANSDRCEFPLYIPATGNYKQEQHLKMLELFRSGIPWVPIECQNFKIFRVYNDGYYNYYAHADSFKVVDYSQILEVTNDER